MRITRTRLATLAATGLLALVAAVPSAATAAPGRAPHTAPDRRPACADGKGDCRLRTAKPKAGKARTFTAKAGLAAPGAGRTAATKAAAAGIPPGGLTAADLQDAYKLPSDLLGGRSTVAVVVPYDTTYAEQDLNTYRAANGMHVCDAEFPCFRKIDQRGGTSLPSPSPNWTLHTAVGLDMASAACPNCDLLLVEADDDSLANQGAAVDRAVAQGARTVVVMDGWFAEYEGQDALAAHFTHPGVAVLAASGSAGFNAGGHQSLPAAYPGVIAVAGTDLYRDPATKRGWSETPWRNAGSGCSVYEKRPSWQPKGACGERRTVADTAAVASDYTPVSAYNSGNGGWVNVSGGPVAPALVAGASGLAGNPASTPAPQRLYGNARYLFDITSGTNGSCGGTSLCTAGSGYDSPSGMGAPNGTGAF
ncbi:hypothetical protein [Actinomadura rupiterrae]|uniref:hypothetical protein n=1 Tax=Actinomadura rupiterrae TaxID=559627 RepID=UPI0020A615A6|nr:hypothetical protein [Actinomadura rupiterrae]MCP2341183.1 hypothetical protein [Actinomadura rupiterrae]